MRAADGGDHVAVAANDDPGVEIRRQNKTTPTVIAVVIAAAVAVVVWRDPGGTAEVPPVSTTVAISDQDTTSTRVTDPYRVTTTTIPIDARLHPVRGVGERDEAAFAFRWQRGSLSRQGSSMLLLGARLAAVATDDLVAVLGEDGALLVGGGANHAFETIDCCFDDLFPSNEPRHVWARVDGTARLIGLDTGALITGIDVGTQTVIGPGAFGLVTADDVGQATWHRPGFDPLPVAAPDGRTAVGAGGDVALYVVAATDVVEVRRLVDGALQRTFDAPGIGPADAAISTVGDAVAVRSDGVTRVFSVESGRELGRIAEASEAELVAIGNRRFAVVVDDSIVASDGQRTGARADRMVIARRAE